MNRDIIILAVTIIENGLDWSLYLMIMSSIFYFFLVPGSTIAGIMVAVAIPLGIMLYAIYEIHGDDGVDLREILEKH